jgi:RNase P/RNase MRP subunit POP5
MSDKKQSFNDVEDAILKSILHLYGIHGLSLIEPKLIEFQFEKQNGILRCNHLYLDKMRSSLAYITFIDKDEVSIHPFYISGTIKSLKNMMKTVSYKQKFDLD